MVDGFRTLFDAHFDVDKTMGLKKARGEEEGIIGDKDISLMMRENRIALAKGKTNRINPPEGSKTNIVCYEIPLICVVHPHPECRFRWSRLMVDFSVTNGARILDMSPLEVKGNTPIEVTTTVGAGLKFETILKVLSPEIKAEHSSKQTVYFPEIVSSGRGLDKGFWDFLAIGEDYLHANKELKILVSAPTDEPLKARFGLRAKVKMAGLVGIIPMIASEDEIDAIYGLT